MRRFYTFLLLLTCAACDMQQDIEVAMPAHTPITFVECYLEPGAPIRALATQSVAFFDSAEVAPADDLDIIIFRNGEQVHLKNEYQVDSLHNNIFNYISKDTVRYDRSSRWEMVVYRQEKEIARSEARFLPKPVIKDISYTLGADSLIALEIELEDNAAEENYYRLRVYAKGEFPGSGFSSLWTDEAAKGGTLRLHTGFSVKTPNDVLHITVYQVDKPYYTYLKSLQKAFDANYNPFAQPANIESNLQGEAMGVFTAVTGTTQTLTIIR